jgi:hypothetical protein
VDFNFNKFIMKKLLVLTLAVLMSVGVASAQNYKYGAGLRFGPSGGFDFKWNHTATNSLEFNLNFPDFNGLSASVAYEWNWPIGDRGHENEGFNAYAGPQASVGLFGRSFMLGIGGLGGIEYKFDIPIALALDYKPTFAFSRGGPHTWGFYDFSIAVRYTF